MSFKLIMPMAGNGSRFTAEGYTAPKPLIDVKGKPMFVRAIDDIKLTFDDMIFIVRKEHNIKDIVLTHYPSAKIVELDGLTEGAACSVLTADQYIDPNDSVFISNCDQIIEWDTNEFDKLRHNDGIILTFDAPDRNPKWSFAQTDNDNNVIRVAEKNPISSTASTGHYYWRRWQTFKQSAEQMFAANDRFNNEFYLCPVFNYTINGGGVVKTFNVSSMHGIGIPEDLNVWLSL
jgi:NDP-sugar pyrophosphorylase family protein